MKTFLHYTKERELDEGVLSRIGGVAGTTTRLASHINKGVEYARNRISPAFAQGAKDGSFLQAVGGVASDITSASEKSRQVSRAHATKTDVNQINTILKRRGRNHPHVQKHEDNLNNISLSHRGNPKKENEQTTEYLKNYAAQLKADPNNTNPPTP